MSRVDQDTAFHALGNSRRGGDREIHADHHPLDSQFPHNRQLRLKRLEPLGKLVGHRHAVLQQPLRLNRLNCRQPGGHRQRVAAKRAGVHPRQQAGGVLVLGNHHSAGHSTSQPLGDRHHVWLDAVVLIPVPATSPAHPRLHLVEHQQRSTTVGDFSQPLQEPRLGQVHATFALDRFDQDRTRLGTSQFTHTVQVVERRIIESGHQRTNSLVVLRLSRRSGGTEGPAVETVVETDDAVTTRLGSVQPHQLQRPLDRLGSTVAEKGLAESTRTQRFSKIALRLGVPGVGNVDQPRHLLLDRGDDPRRTVAQDVAAPAREQVQVPSPLGIPHYRSLAAYQADRVTTVIGNHVLLKLSNRVLAGSLG